MSRHMRRRKNEEYNDRKLIKSLVIFVVILAVFFFTTIIIYWLQNKNLSTEIAQTVENQNENSQNNENKNADIIETFENQEDTEEERKQTDTTFTLTAIGDVMCHNTQYWDAYNSSTKEYDFSYVFDEIKNYTKFTDLTIGSLETSFAGEERGYSNYPTFNSPDNLAYSLKDIGVDILSTAGNHCLDMGFSGLSRTIDVLDKADISHLGTYKTAEDQNKILYKYVKGLKLAFINYTYGTNGIPIPSNAPFCVNLIDKDLIKKHIEIAKSENADIIIACMHWGTEYRTKSNAEQDELADFLFQNGVDVIIGNHPHVLEQMEKRTITLEDGTVKEGFIIYALGNFICDQNYENTRNSIILNLKITKHSDGKITFDKADYVPIYMYKNPSLSIKKMKVLDIEKTIYNYESGTDMSIGKSTYDFLKQQLPKIESIVGKEF